MKKGFTMIELIFVIVILGVLAAVAIPKLNATRDDAEQAKAMTNLATLMGDLTSYYTAQGSFADKISAMTNVPLTEQEGNAGKFDYKIKNAPCLTFETADASLVVTPATSNVNPVCEKILKNTSIQNIIRGTYTCKTSIDNTSTLTAKSATETSGIPATITGNCGNTTGGNYGKPSTLEKTVYHNVISTQLGQTIAANGTVTPIDNISNFTPVVMSFEGAGVKF